MGLRFSLVKSLKPGAAVQPLNGLSALSLLGGVALQPLNGPSAFSLWVAQHFSAAIKSPLHDAALAAEVPLLQAHREALASFRPVPSMVSTHVTPSSEVSYLYV